jgi:hypothetical protein
MSPKVVSHIPFAWLEPVTFNPTQPYQYRFNMTSLKMLKFTWSWSILWKKSTIHQNPIWSNFAMHGTFPHFLTKINVRSCNLLDFYVFKYFPSFLSKLFPPSQNHTCHTHNPSLTAHSGVHWIFMFASGECSWCLLAGVSSLTPSPSWVTYVHEADTRWQPGAVFPSVLHQYWA